MRYVNFTNLDAGFWRLYHEGDRLVQGYSGDIDASLLSRIDVLEALFARHNRDDRPDGRMCPSMSVGDVVKLIWPNDQHEFWSVGQVGFERVDVDPSDLITEQTWLELVRGER